MKRPGTNRARSLLAGVTATWLLASLTMLGVRKTEWFAEWIELPLYDLMTEFTWPWRTGHPDVVLVMIRKVSGWPLDDPSLARLLAGINQGEPAVIAVDLIRDESVPGSGPPTEADSLSGLVLGNPHILMARGIPGEAGQDFAPPPLFSGKSPEEVSEQVGIAGFPLDGKRHRMIRRGVVSIDQGTMFSLPALASLRHAASKDSENLADCLIRLEAIASLQPDSGGYAGNTGGGDQFLLKPGPRIDGLFPMIAAESISQLSQEELLRHFKNKVVFLGTDASIGVKDEVPLVGNPDLRGVKLLALTTAQLIREMEDEEPPIRWLDGRMENAIIALTGLITVLLCFKLPGSLVIRVVTLVPVVAVALFATGCAALKSGTWIPVGAPIGTAALAGIAGYTILLSRERRDRLAMYSLLEKNLSPEVADTIWQNNESLLEGQPIPTELFFGTALFGDLKGYSGITESFQQQGRNKEFISWLNTYLEAIIPTIRQAGGFVQQFAGDGVFVIFGFPKSVSGNHARDAISCAIEIASRIDSLNAARDPALPAYHARIGIYTGEILCGTVGDRHQMQFSFLGSTINKAARLESLQKSTHDTDKQAVRILIGAATHQQTDGEFQASPFSADPVELDSRLPPERVWTIS